MTQRLQQALEKKDLFIPFITAGDPTEQATIELALSLQRSGADVIELGVPYSDPLADGPTIQAASKRALKNGTTLSTILQLVPLMRKKGLTVPIIIFTYANPLYQFGFSQFVNEAATYQIDGVLVPDLPFEESQSFAKQCEDQGLSYISLIAPTSKERMEKIASAAKGFLYCVSSLGVTGVRKELSPDLKQFISSVKQMASVPCVVGFGVSNRAQVEEINHYADGVVNGSAIVKEIERIGESLSQIDSQQAALAEFEAFLMQLMPRSSTASQNHLA